MNVDTDVLIIGAGPTGLTLAAELARFGARFRIIDQSRELTNLSKALAVQARTLEMFERLGIAEEVVRQGHQAQGLSVTVLGRTIDAFDMRGIGGDESPYPFILILEQSKTERILYNLLQSHGHEVAWETQLTGIAQTPDGVESVLQSGDGSQTVVRSRYAVGADGPRSTVRHALGIPFEGGTYERSFYLADAAVDWTLTHDRIHLYLGHERFVAFFPMAGEKRFRVLGFIPDELTGRKIGFEEVRRIVENDSDPPITLADCRWVSEFHLHHRMVDRFREGRVFLCGDAAHIHSPAGGQGMNTGIQDAFNLAWKLVWVLAGRAEDRILDSYHAERAPFAKKLLRLTDRGFSAATAPGFLVSFLRLRVMPFLLPRLTRIARIRKFFFKTISQIGVEYRSSPLTVRTADSRRKSVQAGDRLPYFHIRHPTGEHIISIYQLLRNVNFNALVFSDSPLAMDDFSALFPPHCQTHWIENREENSRARAALGMESGILIIRPDGYICYRGSLNAQAAKGYFEAAGFAVP